MARAGLVGLCGLLGLVAILTLLFSAISAAPFTYALPADDAMPDESPRGLSNAGKSTVAGDTAQRALIVRQKNELADVATTPAPLDAVQRARADPLETLKRAGAAAAGQVAQPAVQLPDSTPILIVSTLDGQLHGIDKVAGKVLWSTSAGGEGVISSAAGQSAAHRASQNPPESLKPKDHEADPDDDLWGWDDEKDDGIDNDVIYSNGGNRPDVLYIAEPMGGGNLYVYQNGRAMQKLPLPIRDLVALSPFRSADGTIYIGRKTTRFLALEPYSGKVVGDYGGADGAASVCEAMNREFAGKDDEECEVTEETVYVGRTDYHLSIFSPPKTGRPVARFNITYAEYSATSLDELSLLLTPQQLHSRDPLRVVPSPAGGVILEDENAGTKKSIRLTTPVVGGFNVFEVNPSAPGALRGRYHLHRVFPGSSPVEDPSKVSALEHAYIGSHNGSLYALSSVHFAPEVTEHLEDGEQKIPTDEETELPSSTSLSSIAPDGSAIGCVPSSEEYPACLAGLRLPVLDPPPLIASLPSGNVTQQTQRPVSSTETPKPSLGYSILRVLWIGTGLVLVAALGAGAVFVYLQYQPLSSNTAEGQHFVSANTKRKRGTRGSGKGGANNAAANNHGNKENGNAVQTAKTENGQAQVGDEEPGTPDTPTTEGENGDVKKGSSTQDGETKDGELAGSATPKLSKRKRKPHSAKRQNKDQQEDQLSRTTSKDNLVTLQPGDVAATLANGAAGVKASAVIGSADNKPLPALPGLPESASPKMIHVTPQILGYGSHGTVVYKGSFQGRECAVKRLLLDFYDVADHEVNLLRESDDHPNVIRYFAKEQCDRFMYIALELCPASIFDIVERGNVDEFKALRAKLTPPQVVYQMMSGIDYLHRLKVVHRDIKPQNILITQGRPKQPPRVVISDFGLGKKLEDNQSSFNNTLHTAAGTVGWRAPECMPHPSNLSDSGQPADSTIGEGHSSSKEFGVTGVRITKAVDIFSAGCVFYYILSGGEHPFGDRYEREVNILRGNFRIDKLSAMGEEGIEAMDLIGAMIAREPKNRPSATDVLTHPYFWTPLQRLNFLQDASDRFEIEVRDPPSELLQKLEANSVDIIGPDWHKKLDRLVIDNLGKHRKYDGGLIRDLLRGLRNKKHHYADLPEPVKRTLGPVPEGFLSYFTNRFPQLLLHVWRVIANDDKLREEFKAYFEVNTSRFG